MFSYDSGAFIFIFSDQALLPDCLLLYANVLYCTFFGTSMALFSVHFIYRYLALSGSPLIKNHNRKVIIFLLLFPIIFGFLWFILSYFTIGPFEEGDLFIRKHYLVDHDIRLSDIHYVGYFFYPEDAQGNTFVNWRGLLGCSIQTFFICVSFALIFYFGFKCYRYTQSLSRKFVHSSNQLSLQSQLFYALVSQTLIPVLLMHIPSTINILTSFVSISFESLAQILALTIALYPALDPLPNFFIIKSYRLAIIGFFKRIADFFLCKDLPPPMNVIHVQSKADLLAASNASMMLY
ncbi:unnamed protein product [Caenorhabditis brenneri]